VEDTILENNADSSRLFETLIFSENNSLDGGMNTPDPNCLAIYGVATL
jgi:hypothetical protein